MKKKKSLCYALCLRQAYKMKRIVCFFVLLTILCPVLAFADMPSEWAGGEVENAINADYVPAEIQSNYTAPITRGEFAHMAIEFLRYELGFSSAELRDKVNFLFDAVEFSDTEDENILLAARCGIVYGYGDATFAPEKPITREEAAAMLARVYNLYGSIYTYANINYQDKDQISDWAVSDVKFCVAKGIMEGVSDSHFEPKGAYTREQSIVTFWRLDTDTAWEHHNKTAKIRRKLSKEIIEWELFANGVVRLIEKYETPYGTVYYTLTGGMMHSPGYELLLIEDSGQTHRLTDVVPSGKVYRYVPEIQNIRFYPEQTHFAFEVTFDTELTVDGNEIHKAGTYYFEANLVQKKTTLVNFIPKDNKSVLKQGVQAYIEKAKVLEVIEEMDTGAYGILLYVKTDMGFPTDVDDRYYLVLIGNDGKAHLLPVGPVISRYGQLPPLSDIRLSEYNAVVSYERVYTGENISSSSEVQEPGVYSCAVNLITLESEQKFIPSK